MEVKGIFVTRFSKADAKICFDEIATKYGNRKALIGGNSMQKNAMMKSYCNDLTEMIDKVFFGEMYGASRCKRRINELSKKPIDDMHLQSSISEILGIIIDLNNIIKDSTPINELPSCKPLTEMEVEDAISASKDLVENCVVKVVIGTLLTFVNAGKIVGVIEVRNYYKDLKKELEFELKEERREATEIEQFLMDKYEAEIGYCNLAGLKVGLSGFNEVVDLADNAKKAIDKFNSRVGNTPVSIKQ